MDEYFVTAQPKPTPPDPEPELTPRQKLVVEQLDFSSRRAAGRDWVRGVSVTAQVMLGIGMLMVAALPLLGLYLVFDFIESLPW